MRLKNLNFVEYLEQLQKEYIVAKIRKEIYIREKDKNYYTRVMNDKKKIIDSISEQNSFPSIFTEKVELNRFTKMIVSEYGIPNFIYRDKAHKDECYELDRLYYYYVGTKVEVLESLDSKRKGIVISFDYDSEIVRIRLEGDFKIKEFFTNRVKRLNLFNG